MTASNQSSNPSTCKPNITIKLIQIAAIRNLRNNPHLLFVRVPSLLSFLCIVVGVVWLLLLPLNEYSRQTYISENALLPGQVHAYFSGSEQNVFRGYKKELEALWFADEEYTNAVGSSELTPVYVASSMFLSDWLID